MERLRAGVDPAAGGLDRVAVGLLGAAFALHQLDDFAVLHIDRGDDFELREHTSPWASGVRKRTGYGDRVAGYSAPRPETATRMRHPEYGTPEWATPIGRRT
ncbi:hypothetical protein GCM10007209_09150 [Haloferax sulfurifontis]|uniref:Uncharacterized protein n=1 Tax=Haloferax sulfurifontis TaxID=255616 RepID=A0A830E3E1_9EURY|nr:hypothetical protein GCM10007209_09150 [Haloferax sulfurifontis]